MGITIAAVLFLTMSQISFSLTDVASGKNDLMIEKENLLDMMGKTLKEWYTLTEKERQAKYACPTSPYFMETPALPEKNCTKLLDCIEEKDELCCYWSSSQTSHCLKGILKEKRPGSCPTPGPWNDACLADYSGCLYDSECTSHSEKCCRGLCGYKECLNIRQNLGCPIAITLSKKSCSKDDDCGLEEKCCGEAESKTCQTGVDISRKPGFCFRTMHPTPEQCSNMTTDGCNYDSECPDVKKCCSNGCGSKGCTEQPFKKEVTEGTLIKLLKKALTSQ